MATTHSTPVDYFGLDSSPLKLKGSKENTAASVTEGHDDGGDIVAREVYGPYAAPDCTFEVIATAGLSLVLGTIETVNSKPYMLAGANITTKFGTPPVVTAKGMELQSGATVSRTITVGSISLSKLHIATILAGAFTLTGSDCELQECSAEISANATTAKVAGLIVAHDIHGGKIVVKATINQYDATVPTVTAAVGWEITAPLTCENPDEDYKVWTVELTKNLTSAEPAP